MILDDLIAANYVLHPELVAGILDYLTNNSLEKLLDALPKPNSFIIEVEYYQDSKLISYLEQCSKNLSDYYKIIMFSFLSPDERVRLVNKTNLSEIINDGIELKLSLLRHNLFGAVNVRKQMLDEFLKSMPAHILAVIASKKEYSNIIFTVLDDLEITDRKIIIPHISQDAFNAEYSLCNFNRKLALLRMGSSQQKLDLFNSKNFEYKLKEEHVIKANVFLRDVKLKLADIYQNLYGKQPNLSMCAAKIEILIEIYAKNASSLKILLNRRLNNNIRLFNALKLNMQSDRSIRYLANKFNAEAKKIKTLLVAISSLANPVKMCNQQIESLLPPKLISPITNDLIKHPLIDRYGNIMCYDNLIKMKFKSPYNRVKLTANDYVLLTHDEALRLQEINVGYQYFKAATDAKELKELVIKLLEDGKPILGKRKRCFV